MLVVCWWLMPLSPSNTGSPPSRPCCPFHCEQTLHHPSFFVLRDSDSETRKYVSDWLSLGHMIPSTSIIFLSLTLTHCSIFLWFVLVHQGLTHNDHSPQALWPSGFHWLEQCKVLTAGKRVRRERSQAVSPPLPSFSLQCRSSRGTPFSRDIIFPWVVLFLGSELTKKVFLLFLSPDLRIWKAYFQIWKAYW